jgi:hypothetical protein
MPSHNFNELTDAIHLTAHLLFALLILVRVVMYAVCVLPL